MEGVRRHISETQNDVSLEKQTESTESAPERDRVEYGSSGKVPEYDPATETSPEQIRVRQILDRVDEKLLKEIYGTYFRKAGSQMASMNWVPLSKVRIECSPQIESDVDDIAGHTNLGAHSLAEGITLNATELADGGDADVLWVLMHEQCHAVSQMNLDVSENLVDHVATITIDDRSGLRTEKDETVLTFDSNGKIASNHTSEGVKWRRVNEGVTQLLTERIFREYLQRSGHNPYSDIGPDTPERYKELQIEETVFGQKTESYNYEWRSVRFYIEVVSIVTNIPREVVEESVIRAYLRNGSLDPRLDSDMFKAQKEIDDSLPYILYSIADMNPDLSLKQGAEWLIHESSLSYAIREKIRLAYNQIMHEWRGESRTAEN